ncbi:MAG: TonB-dependent receptor plug domain-containing protein [Tannerellaceae bacterium]|jgi:iron complex outermembrane receptor protein|nr:TonB-dependent receptor plug domain-containing protein [Tannerellaceae bacterium]
MKSVLFFTAALLLPAAVYGDKLPVDSFRISKNVSLDEVVIIAAKAVKGTPVAYSDLSKEELSKQNDGQGIPYLISQTPSVVMTSDAGTGIGYSGFRIRGTDANRINITVNGVPVNDSESHGVFWVNMPDFASSVENIQIQRGAGTSTNGPASFGATVAMQTENPPMKPYGEYALSTGSFGTVRHTVKGGTGLLHNHFVFNARYSDIRSDGFIDRASARMKSYFVSAAWYGEHTLIKAQTFGSSETTYQAWNGVPSEMLHPSDPDIKPNRTFNSCGMYVENGETKFYDNQTDNYRQEHYHLTGSQRLGDFWNMNLTLHYTPGNGYYEDYKANAKFSSYKLPDYSDPEGNEMKRTDLIRRKWLVNDFYGGIYTANYQSDKLQLTFGTAVNNYVGNHFGRVMWTKSANSLPAPDYEYYRNKGEKLDYNTYAKANWLFHPNLNGYVDLQYRGINYTINGSDDKAGDNLHIDKHWDFFNPKVGLNYRKNNHDAFVSFSVANREPNRDNFTEAAPNERPTHETLHDYEAGYHFRNSHFHIGANVYYMNYNNQLILSGKISEIGEALTTNIKDSYRMGIELTGSAAITQWLNWSGNLTLSRNKIKDFTEYVDDWDTGRQVSNYLGATTIAFSPDIIANSIFDVSYKGFSAGFHSQFAGRQYVDNTSSKDRSIDPYFVNSLRLGYVFKLTFMKEIAVDVTVNNLFNEEYETNAWVYSYMEGGIRKKDDGYFTQAGTNAMARVTFTF